MKITPLTTVLAAAFLTTGLLSISATQADDHKKTQPTDEQDFTVLFDGSSTDHFRGYNKEAFPEKGWTLEDGCIRVIGKTRGSGDIITKEQYSDFDLRWEWKVAKGANSGIMYRVEEVKNQPTYKTGPEYQILEDGNHRDGKNTKTSAAALYALIACNDKKTLKPIGEWNNSRIVIKDNNVQHYLNGEVVVQYTWGSDDIKEKIAGSKFKNWGEFMTKDKGHIAFQYHNDDVWYRNIRIKDLSGK
ncbi:MAG: 3-keto-disaccharide hydrolase [Phycisphaeraceae bacterium]